MRHWKWGMPLVAAAIAVPAMALFGGSAADAQQPTPAATARPAQATATPSRGAPTPPNRVYGSATLNGSPAPNGATVVALVGSTSCGTGTVTGGTYMVDVNSSFTQPGCGTEGGAVAFTINGVRASQTINFQTGAFTKLDLTAQAAPTVTRTVTPPTRTVTPPTRTVTPPTRTVTPPTRTVTPAGPPVQRPAGAPQAQAPKRAPARPAAQAARPAPAALPRTGAATTDTQTPLWLALAMVAVVGAGGAVVARRRS